MLGSKGPKKKNTRLLESPISTFKVKVQALSTNSTLKKTASKAGSPGLILGQKLKIAYRLYSETRSSGPCVTSVRSVKSSSDGKWTSASSLGIFEVTRKQPKPYETYRNLCSFKSNTVQTHQERWVNTVRVRRI